MASEWGKFVVPGEHLVPGRARADAAPPAGRIADVELAVTLEALLDVKDIARLDMAELRPLKRALSRVDRETSIASWPRAEPVPITAWRRGVVGRAPRSDVAGAILLALEPYHALLRKGRGARPTVTVRLPAARVADIRRNAVMTAWFQQVKRIIGRDPVERDAWLRYWISVSSPLGTAEHTILWQRGARQRADAGSGVARRLVESVIERDRAMAEIDRASLQSDAIVVRVPGLTRQPPPATTTG